MVQGPNHDPASNGAWISWTTCCLASDDGAVRSSWPKDMIHVARKHQEPPESGPSELLPEFHLFASSALEFPIRCADARSNLQFDDAIVIDPHHEAADSLTIPFEMKIPIQRQHLSFIRIGFLAGAPHNSPQRW